MRALEVFQQSDGDVTKAFYADLAKRGPVGEIAVCLFRAQKRSTAAKKYRRGRFKHAAYDVKSWSMGELCKHLSAYGELLGIGWGWKQDPATVFGMDASWVLYVDIPEFGQCSFHSPNRFGGPEYVKEWDGRRCSADVVIQFADSVYSGGVCAAS